MGSSQSPKTTHGLETVDDQLLFLNLLPASQKIQAMRFLASFDEALEEKLHVVIDRLHQMYPVDLFDRALTHFANEKHELTTKKHAWLSLANPRYPALLREIATPPPVLYYRGDLNCLEKPSLSIVGSRKATIEGLRNTHNFSTCLCQRLVLVSGGAFGIDSAAHWASVRSKAPTVAVLGCGIDITYPAFNHALFHDIVATGGLLLTEFSLHSRPMPHHFPQRNRILAGLTPATLIVEAAKKSGSLITARHAIETNREIFVIPTSIHNPNSEGVLKLIESGAIPLRSPEALFEHSPYNRLFEIVTAP